MRIVHVDDDVRGKKVADNFFRRGLQADDTKFETYEDWEQVDKDITSGDLAYVYILDNDIPYDRAGGSVAQQIHDKAQELQLSGQLDHPVLVITLLCSNPDKVREIFGDGLQKRSIPVLSRVTDVFLCGFYIGNAIEKYRKKMEKEIPTFDQWLQETDIGLLRDRKNSDSVTSINGKAMAETEEGSCFIPLPDFVQAKWDLLVDRMRAENPANRQLLERVFRPTSGPAKEM